MEPPRVERDRSPPAGYLDFDLDAAMREPECLPRGSPTKSPRPQLASIRPPRGHGTGAPLEQGSTRLQLPHEVPIMRIRFRSLAGC